MTDDDLGQVGDYGADLRAKVAGLLESCGKDGWDSYGAGALTVEAVDATATTIANALFPTVNGGLMVEWETADRDVSLVVEFSDEGSIIGFYATNGTREVEWDVEPSGSQDGPS